MSLRDRRVGRTGFDKVPAERREGKTGVHDPTIAIANDRAGQADQFLARLDVCRRRRLTVVCGGATA